MVGSVPQQAPKPFLMAALVEILVCQKSGWKEDKANSSGLDVSVSKLSE